MSKCSMDKYCDFPPKIITAKVKDVIKENYRVQTILIDKKIDSKPGQFVMVWIPGVDEKPFSVGGDDPILLSVAAIGPFSKEICKIKKGDKVSFHGPYGKNFNFKNSKNIILIGGGYGVVPMYYIAKEAEKLGINCDVIIGARTKDDLIFESKFEKLKNCKLHVSTNDGSKGTKGFVTHVLEPILKQKNHDKIFACGPNVMMQAIGKMAEQFDVDYEFSVEEYMKCGIGLCGTCTYSDKIVCMDGTVFGREDLKKMKFVK